MQKRTYKRRALGVGDVAALASCRSITEAAKRLDVDRSTVHRWLKAGVIPPFTRPARRARRAASNARASARTPDAWARRIRRLYELSETELQLVDLGRRMLALMRDKSLRPEQQAAVAGRFQAIARQLDLPTEDENGEVESESETRATVARWPRPA